MELPLQPMTHDDVEAVLALWSETEGVGLHESDSPDRVRAYLDRNPGMSLVARDAERIVAAVMCGHDGRRGCLYHLAVAPGYRTQGLGRSLVDRCLASLAAAGILRCNIFLYADNDLGEQFWRQCGWKRRVDLAVLQREINSK